MRAPFQTISRIARSLFALARLPLGQRPRARDSASAAADRSSSRRKQALHLGRRDVLARGLVVAQRVDPLRGAAKLASHQATPSISLIDQGLQLVLGGIGVRELGEGPAAIAAERVDGGHPQVSRGLRLGLVGLVALALHLQHDMERLGRRCRCGPESRGCSAATCRRRDKGSRSRAPDSWHRPARGDGPSSVRSELVPPTWMSSHVADVRSRWAGAGSPARLRGGEVDVAGRSSGIVGIEHRQDTPRTAPARAGDVDLLRCASELLLIEDRADRHVLGDEVALVEPASREPLDLREQVLLRETRPRRGNASRAGAWRG